MNVRPRLIATDLDGTIVKHDGSVSARVVQALAAAMDAGVRVVFVTGRPPRWMHEVAEATGHSGVGICGNGAFVYDMQTEDVLETFAMSADVAQTAVTRVRGVLPGSAFAVEALAGFSYEPAYKPRWDIHEPSAVGPIQDLLDGPIAKLLVRDDAVPGDDMLRIAEPTLSGVVEVTHSNVNDSLLELSALGVTKATTLAKLAAQWGITHDEVVAFGDMPNDVDMLQWAGRGYAVGNAHPSVLAVSDERAPSIEDDGVAQVLERLLAL
ncbi:MAG: Cof-type HAD-IIB family hydrolase [Actinomycetia bacterium]|nr:Cof-type HAD-IIB family hydrolase [Actinomycetes bacterium]